MNVEEIEMMVKSGKVAQADARLKEIVDKNPDDVKAKLLYGMCRQILGDEETFRKIHDEVESRIGKEKDEKTLSVWRKYRALWLSLAVGALLLGGTVAVAYFGKVIVAQTNAATQALSAYAGPSRLLLQKDAAMETRVNAGEKFNDAEVP